MSGSHGIVIRNRNKDAAGTLPLALLEVSKGKYHDSFTYQSRSISGGCAANLGRANGPQCRHAIAGSTTAAQPGLLERLGVIRSKKSDAARVIYARMLKRSVAGEDLSEKDLIAFGDAQQAAGISNDELTYHRDLLNGRARADADAVKERTALKERQAATATLAAFEANDLVEFQRKYDAVRRRADDAYWRHNPLLGSVEKAAGLAAEIAEVLPE